MVSLARYATEAAASFPSTVIRRRHPMSTPHHRLESQQRAGVARNDEFFVSRDDPRRNPASRSGDPRAPFAVRIRVHVEAEPGGSGANPAADFGRVLTDPGG